MEGGNFRSKCIFVYEISREDAELHNETWYSLKLDIANAFKFPLTIYVLEQGAPCFTLF